MSAKYQVFVSSTFQDLHEERDLVIKAILEMGHIPVGMEMFSAADEYWRLTNFGAKLLALMRRRRLESVESLAKLEPVVTDAKKDL
jgi:hypothetical protein